MDIRLARKIADDVGGNWTNDERRKAFHRLDLAVMRPRLEKARAEDHKRAKAIWDFFGNLGVKGKTNA